MDWVLILTLAGGTQFAHLPQVVQVGMQSEELCEAAAAKVINESGYVSIKGISNERFEFAANPFRWAMCLRVQETSE